MHDIGISKSPIAYQDSLIDTSDKMYQVVMTNPPFGTRPQGSVDVSANRPEFIKTSDNQVNFLQHIMSIVKTGGRVGVVMPDSILIDGDSTKKVRDKLLKDFNLYAVAFALLIIIVGQTTIERSDFFMRSRHFDIKKTRHNFLYLV